MTGPEKDIPSPNGQRETLVSLRDYLDSEVEHERELRETQAAAHQREHNLADRALELAATMAKANKEDANEWRGAMTDRERSFFPRSEAEAQSARLLALERADIARSTREQERERSTLRTMAAIGLLSTIAGVVLSVLINGLRLGQ